MHSCQVATELLWAAALDHVGWLGAPKKRLTRLRALGVACAALGVVLAAAGAGGWDGPGVGGASLLPWIAVAMLAGVTRTSQTFVNGSLSRSLASKEDAATWSLGTASLVLAVLAPADAYLHSGGVDADVAAQGVKPWMLVGGLFSSCSVYGAVLLAPRISVSGLYMGIMLGQASMSVVADQFGLFGLARHPATVLRLAGVGAILLGMLAVSAGDAQAARPSPARLPPGLSATPVGKPHACSPCAECDDLGEDITDPEEGGGSPKSMTPSATKKEKPKRYARVAQAEGAQGAEAEEDGGVASGGEAADCSGAQHGQEGSAAGGDADCASTAAASTAEP
mmetsp:Transcript_8024/g.24753  ORF Transcript_8024/g.24753 Transcript_8024/m.24753 type:complete len:338 (+) Transcript_8024:1-1014(+)